MEPVLAWAVLLATVVIVVCILYRGIGESMASTVVAVWYDEPDWVNYERWKAQELARIEVETIEWQAGLIEYPPLSFEERWGITAPQSAAWVSRRYPT